MNDWTNIKLFEIVFRILRRWTWFGKNKHRYWRKKSMHRLFPVIEQIEKNDTDLYKYLEDLMKVLNIDYNAKNNSDIFKNIINEIINWKSKCLSVEVKLAAQDQRFSALENSMKLPQANMIAYDLLRLLLFYFVGPAISGGTRKSVREWYGLSEGRRLWSKTIFVVWKMSIQSFTLIYNTMKYGRNTVATKRA
jgi:hypothetical protein